MSDIDELREYVAAAERRVRPMRDGEWITAAPRADHDSLAPQAAIDLAATLAETGKLETGTRLAGVKSAMLRAMVLVTRDQNAFNVAAVTALESIASSQRDLSSRLSRGLATVASVETALTSLGNDLDAAKTSLGNDLDAAKTSLGNDLDAAKTSLGNDLDAAKKEQAAHGTDSRSSLAKLRSELAKMSVEVSEQAEALRVQDDRLVMLLQEARRRLPEAFDDGQLRTFSDQIAGRFDAVYTEFENRYRGSRHGILRRLEQYLDLLDLPDVAKLGPIVDVGCGRGEWLEFLGRLDLPAYGVDINENISAVAASHGLDVRIEDGLEHLRSGAPGSVGMVSMFHVAEHLDFETLFDVMRASLRALAPGGILLVETPNPSNLSVGASSFYLDPTHVKPLPSQLAEFVAGAAGFTDVSVHFLNPSTELPFEVPGSLAGDPEFERLLDHVNWALLGPMDYALIAKKPGG